MTFDELAEELIERKYQLRIEHNHGDMKWYAYYARKGATVRLFDEDAHWQTGSNTPTEALQKLKDTELQIRSRYWINTND